jgi:hypothetical protein
VIKQGYLSKKTQAKGRHDWKRRFFVLDSKCRSFACTTA